MNDTFTPARVFQLLKLHFRSHFLLICVSWAVQMLTMIGTNYLCVKSTDTPETALAGLTVLMFVHVFVMIFNMQILDSRAFVQYHKRESSTPLLMLPSSREEQYVALTLLYMVFVPIVYITGGVLIEYLFISHQLSLSPELMDALMMRMPNVSVAGWVGMITFIFGATSLFFAGSVWFKSFAFIKTCLVVLGFIVLLSIISSISGDLISSLVDSYELAVDDGSFGLWLYPIVFTILMIGLGWWKFKRLVLP